MVDRLVVLAAGGERVSQVVVGCGKIGPGLQGQPVLDDRLVEIPLAGQHVGEIIVGLRVVGLDFHGVAVVGDGLVDLAAAGQGKAKIVVGVGVLRSAGQRVGPQALGVAPVPHVLPSADDQPCQQQRRDA